MTTAVAPRPAAADSSVTPAASPASPGPHAAHCTDRRSQTRLVAVPDSEPPFDDEVSPTDRVRRSRSVPAARRRSSAALKVATAPTATAPTAIAPALTAQPRSLLPARPAARHPAPAGQPPLRQVSTVLARALVEVVTGVRGVTQLRDHCNPGVFTTLLETRPQRGTELAKLQSTHVRQDRPDVAEVAAVFRRGARVRALAFQLTYRENGRWQITALQVG